MIPDIRIEMLNDQEEWVCFKPIGLLSGDEHVDYANWRLVIEEVSKLNLSGIKYRAIVDCPPLTHIYCSGFYTVPTLRFW